MKPPKSPCPTARGRKAKNVKAMGRLIKTPGLNEAEFAILVPDQWHGEGLGTALLQALVAIARKAGVRTYPAVRMSLMLGAAP